MKYLVAVSGGIDSVVLLDMLVRSWRNTAEGTRRKPSFSGRGESWDLFPKRSGGQGPPITIAHFDHGIRSDSAADARFVEGLAAKYGVPFVGRREELGAKASEEVARTRRYTFLRDEAKRRQATLVTAHHADDVVETVALNIYRGTGWRGLAVLDTPDINRPLLNFRKEQIREYALENRLEWVEDSTNATDVYLRNRLRSRIYQALTEDRWRSVLELRNRQTTLKQRIDHEVARHIIRRGPGEYDRYFLTCIDAASAAEIVRAIVIEAAGYSPTRPQLNQLILAIKTAKTKTSFVLGRIEIIFTEKTFAITVKTP